MHCGECISWVVASLGYWGKCWIGVIVPYSYLMFAFFHKYLKTLEFCGRYFGKLMIHDLQIMLVFALSESFSVIY